MKPFTACPPTLFSSATRSLNRNQFKPNLGAHRATTVKMASSSASAPIDGMVIGVNPDNTLSSETLSSASKLLDQANDFPDLQSQWVAARGQASKPGQLRMLHPVSSSSSPQPALAAVSLGAQKPAPSTGPDTLPQPDVFLRNEMLERTRSAAAKGVKALRDLGAPSDASADKEKKLPTKRAIAVDGMYSPHAAAVGAHLGVFSFNHFKTRGGPEKAGYKLPTELKGGAQIEILPLQQGDPESLKDEGDELKQLIAAGGEGGVPQLSWKTGVAYAEAQNWARELKETPAK